MNNRYSERVKKMRGIKTLRASAVVLLILSIAFITVGASPSETVMRVEPEYNSGAPGSTFTVDILLYDVVDCFAWQANLTWDTSVLNVSSDYLPPPYDTHIPRLTFGDFLAETYGTEVSDSYLINFTGGWIMFAQSVVGEYPGVDGSGWLATLEFKVLTGASAVIDIASNYWLGGPPYASTTILDRFLEEMPMTVLNGYFVHIADPWPTDLNADGVIDIRDLAMVAIKYGWSGSPGGIPEDITGPGDVPDGQVDIWDLSAVAQDYGTHYA